MKENCQNNKKWSKNECSSVKECLQPDEGTPFQLLIAKLRNTNRDSYWNQEVDKTRYRVSNLPVGMNPDNTTFGKTYRFDGGFAEIMKSMITDINEDPKKGLNERKIERHECPFDKLQRFGKKSDSNWEGLRVKKLLQWSNSDPVTKVICLQADFYNRSQPPIGKIKKSTENQNNENLPSNIAFGKPTNYIEISEILKPSHSNSREIKKISKALRNINKIRMILKRRREVFFTKIDEELKKFDKDDTKSVDIKLLFEVFRQFRIFPEKEVFCNLLEILKFLHEDKVNYPKAINLFNWNCEFPEIPKTEMTPTTRWLLRLTCFLTNSQNIKALPNPVNMNSEHNTSYKMQAPSVSAPSQYP
ncbi:uncharacterized protein LOC122511524 [Leptopilina heterotoma]|uniref:uncharacterized protein LOC122511524 n=1 Tax=Leptopilina heterotoma TaxID=63436 RepID=UPI001CA833E6|nr:uncharacterized protein LOC122511524 [Leptopilina heterotoma]